MIHMDKEAGNKTGNRKRKIGVLWAEETRYLVTTKLTRNGEEMRLSSP
jgi:hypothetical protein